MMKLCVILIFIAIALYLPPVALLILLLMADKITIWPAIIYMFVISGIYAMKNRRRE